MDNKQEIKVTVAILAHNQISYIRQAIESVVEQETNFRYEVIIHDDFSSDGTKEIIEEYARRYPEIIVPVFEEVNQWTKGNDFLQLAIWKYVRGEYYIALDGDDYWCDKYKLQKQVDFLEKNPNYIAHTHLTKRVNEYTNEVSYSPEKRENGQEWKPEEIIDWYDVFQTSSLMYKSYIQKDIPREFIAFSRQDYPIALWLCVKGRIAYSDWMMHIHRMNAIGSCTSARFGNGSAFKTIDAAQKSLEERTQLLELFNQLTELKYQDVIERSRERRLFDILWSEKKYHEAFGTGYFKNLPKKKRAYYICLRFCPVIVDVKNRFLGTN